MFMGCLQLSLYILARICVLPVFPVFLRAGRILLSMFQVNIYLFFWTKFCNFWGGGSIPCLYSLYSLFISCAGRFGSWSVFGLGYTYRSWGGGPFPFMGVNDWQGRSRSDGFRVFAAIIFHFVLSIFYFPSLVWFTQFVSTFGQAYFLRLHVFRPRRAFGSGFQRLLHNFGSTGLPLVCWLTSLVRGQSLCSYLPSRSGPMSCHFSLSELSRYKIIMSLRLQRGTQKSTPCVLLQSGRVDSWSVRRFWIYSRSFDGPGSLSPNSDNWFYSLRTSSLSENLRLGVFWPVF